MKFTDEGSPEQTMYLLDVTVLWLPVLKWCCTLLMNTLFHYLNKLQ